VNWVSKVALIMNGMSLWSNASTHDELGRDCPVKSSRITCWHHFINFIRTQLHPPFRKHNDAIGRQNIFSIAYLRSLSRMPLPRPISMLVSWRILALFSVFLDVLRPSQTQIKAMTTADHSQPISFFEAGPICVYVSSDRVNSMIRQLY
jgi:hypothetical protein